MNQVGSVGQRKLLNAKVLIVGAGGLGSPVAVYLALAGIGTIGIVDFDVVDVTNLQRQILHQEKDVGKAKALSALETLKSYNKDVDVRVHEFPLTSENALETIEKYDVVVNGAELKDGMLIVELEKIVPDSKKPRTIDIKSVSYTHLTLPTIYSV